MTNLSDELRRLLISNTIYLGWSVFEVSSSPHGNYRDIRQSIVDRVHVSVRYTATSERPHALRESSGPVWLSVRCVATSAMYERDALKLLDSQIERAAALERADRLIRHADKNGYEKLSAHFRAMRAQMEGAKNALFVK